MFSSRQCLQSHEAEFFAGKLTLSEEGKALDAKWYVFKRFSVAQLLDPDYEKRISKIEHFTASTIAPVRFIRHQDILLRATRKLYCRKVPFRNPDTAQAIDFAEKIAKMHECGIVHGDLHPKNIMIVKDEPIVLDWEPSLLQRQNGVKALMCTQPWIDPQDKSNKTISTRTDWLCFARLVGQFNKPQCMEKMPLWAKHGFNPQPHQISQFVADLKQV